MNFNISIHAAQEGCDEWQITKVEHRLISIHAAQEGCDINREMYRCAATDNFNPRSPRGLRPALYIIILDCKHFNPRSPRGLRQLLKAL